jgi:AcrR family transcriptional regulator
MTIQVKSRRDIEFCTRRQFILQAARRLLTTREIEAVSMEDIAAAVEYTRRTLYAYFKSRDEILLLVLCEDLAERWALQKEAMTNVESGLAKIMVWGEVLYQYGQEHPRSVDLQAYWDYTGINRDKLGDSAFRDFETLNNDLADGLRSIFRLGVSDGSLRPDLEVDVAISQFLYSLRSVIHRALSPTYSFAQFAPDEYVAHFLDLFRRGICNEGEVPDESS